MVIWIKFKKKKKKAKSISNYTVIKDSINTYFFLLNFEAII